MASATPLPAPDRDRLAALAGILRRLRGSARMVSWRRAERDCEALAAAVRAEVPPSELATLTFRAIPRGGLVVLGLLAYPLDLRADQLEPGATGRPVCLVDDCAMTGARLASTLDRMEDSSVLFAHLYSPPGLRAAVAEQEPRVRAVIAACDLADHAPATAEWQTRWRGRLEGRRYWVGEPDLVCFPWSEPDRPFWNPATGRVESGWRFLPPHACLRNRAELGLPPRPDVRRRWRVPAHVAYGCFDGTVLLVHCGSGSTWGVHGVSAELWRGLAAYGDEAAAAESVAGEDGGELQARAGALAAALAAADLLEAADGGD